ncbi:hypothetical protein [Perlabentimonas gracilis]|uniref:hypothetical protein n=1 Tax=Perlabentimonas gracilis TaxID=2715279 RepID=UPI00140994CF|nr:hypothetical protein [Perlabentimonas gracilis]
MKKHKNIIEICKEIDLIVEKKDNKKDYKKLYYDLLNVLQEEIEYSEIVIFCNTVLKIAKTKNRILRYLEKDFWNFINELPFKILLIQSNEITENEEIEPNIEYNNHGKKILSKILGLSIEILELPDDNSNGSELRRANALKLIADLNSYYIIPDVKTLFLNSIKSKNADEQYNALEGLEHYYDMTEDQIDDGLVKTLNSIIKETNERTVASTCLQIQINAGIINEMTAICEIDDWKDEHY